MQVDLIDNTDTLIDEHLELMKKLVLFVAKEENIPEVAELSISIVNNKKIQELNKLYRQKDQVTDVLSFALQDTIEEEVTIKDNMMPLLLGDIIISIDRAREQASEFNHSLKRELGFLVVHGLLHLLGFDHMNESDEKEMFGKQNELLARFGLVR